MKKEFYYLLVVLLLLQACATRKYINKYNEEAKWTNLHYKLYKKALQVADTSCLFVSNRIYAPKVVRFASDEIDTTQVQYFLIQKQGNAGWNVHELRNLEEGIAAMPKRDWVVYTEGMGKLFTGNIERAHLMTQTYGVNVLLFDYASFHSEYGLGKNFNYSLHNARKSFRQYYHLLSQVADLRSKGAFDSNSVSIFLHSMGNLMLREMLNDDKLKPLPPFANNLILNAACVPEREHSTWLSKVGFAKQIYVHYNHADKKLRAAQWITGNFKLGTRPKNRLSTVHYINFHESVGSTHSYFLWIPGRANPVSPEIKSYYSHVLHGKSVSFDESFFSVQSKKADYSIKRNPAFPAK